MKLDFKKILPHILIVLAFVIVALAYFSPVLSGKVIYQSDIAQYIGMSKQQHDFRQETGQETYWTDSAFGGMPTYQLGAHYPYNIIKKIDLGLRFLPRPADYLFLYFIGLYILLLVLKVEYRIAFVGALAFGFSTYLIILLGVGHNSKAHAIAYMPLVLAGIIATFRRNDLWGGVLLALGMALEINANHFQMTYYLLLLVLVLGVVYLYDAVKRKMVPSFLKALGIMVIAVVLAIGTNATSILATKQYTDFSTRGDTGLTIDKNGAPTKSEGLSYNYITEYSYGIIETFNLFIPRFMGGASTEKLSSDSNSYKALLKLGANSQQAHQFVQSAPTYWGPQTFIGAPAYIGATLIFLFVFALFLIRGRLKWWIVGGSLLALFLSWGNHFAFLTKFFIEYVPLYDKFRAVSSIQVILELLIPVFALYGFSKIFKERYSKNEKLHALKWSLIITGGISVLLLLLKSSLFDFVGAHDANYQKQLGANFMRALREDRKAIFTTDTLRSLAFVVLCAAVIWGFLKKKVTKPLAIGGIAILILIDLVTVDKRYVNNDDFVSKRQMEQPFQANAADLQINKDKGHFRVFDLSGSPFNSARASYFHNAIGGYHAAKPARMQELYDFYLSEGNQKILNMLNTKYIIIKNQGKTIAQPNPEAFGNAWLVENVKEVNSVNKEITTLGTINPKKTAVVNKKFSKLLPEQSFSPNSSDTIQLKKYQPNRLVYQYSINKKRLALFSEMYYPHGWNAYVDGKKIPIIQANYVLRGAVLPAGKHNIIFKFEPKIIATGSAITLSSCILLGIIIIGGIGFSIKNRKKKTSAEEQPNSTP